MLKKWPLYIGLSLLAVGIVLKIATTYTVVPLIIMLSGISFKIYYITIKIIRKEYKPGFELYLLVSGLAIFFTAIFLTQQGLLNTPTSILFKTTGISLKAAFLLMFILKTRGTKSIGKPVSI